MQIMSKGLSDIFGDLSNDLVQLNREMEIITESLRENESSNDAMGILVDSKENQMRTSSPLYTDEAVAREMTQEGHEIQEYIYNRIQQIFGGD